MDRMTAWFILIGQAAESDRGRRNARGACLGATGRKESALAGGSAKRLFYVVTGSLALALGAVGVFVPVLPTTPFLLLAAFCYLRGSRRMYDWLMTHRVFGPYIYNYVNYRAVKKSVKIGTLVFLWATLLVSALIVSDMAVGAILAVIGIGVSIHVLTLKTLDGGVAGGE